MMDIKQKSIEDLLRERSEIESRCSQKECEIYDARQDFKNTKEYKKWEKIADRISHDDFDDFWGHYYKTFKEATQDCLKHFNIAKKTKEYKYLIKLKKEYKILEKECFSKEDEMDEIYDKR